MHVYVVFAHPGKECFNRAVLEAFTRGLQEAGHSYEIGDLYEMAFLSEMDAAQYEREVGLDPGAPVPQDVRAEQDKIDRADALAFVYPVWWSDCPAKLKGWFDKRKKLPEGYRIIKGTVEETLIELSDADWSTREGARKDAQKLLGLYPTETVNVKHGFDDIIRGVIKDIHAASNGLPPLPSQEVEE